jgi:hypothetical protein
MSNNKQIIIGLLKEYVEHTRQISDLQNQMKDFRNKKKQIETKLIQFMETNEIDEFDINNGKVIHKKVKTKGSINKNYLLTVLGSYFENNPEIDNEDLGKFIFDNRPVKESSSLVVKKN